MELLKSRLHYADSTDTAFLIHNVEHAPGASSQMPSRAGLSLLLSFLIVGLAALILVRPHEPASRVLAQPGADLPSASAPRNPQDRTPLPEPTAGAPWNPGENSKSSSRTEPAARWPRPARAFTSVEPGESLETVAFRIYGTTDAADHLWESNRDLLPDRQSQLLPGQPLRTP